MPDGEGEAPIDSGFGGSVASAVHNKADVRIGFLEARQEHDRFHQAVCEMAGVYSPWNFE
jgi:hypothetical protein